MKILLLGNYVLDKQNSMQLFAEVLEKELLKIKHDVRLVRPEPFFGKISCLGKGLRKWRGYLDKFFIFPFIFRRHLPWPDIVHICDHSNAFYTKRPKAKPYLVTCHDLIAVRSALGEFSGHQTGWTGENPTEAYT